MSFLVLAMAPENVPKTVSETCTKWSSFGAVSETWGLVFKTKQKMGKPKFNWRKWNCLRHFLGF